MERYALGQSSILYAQLPPCLIKQKHLMENALLLSAFFVVLGNYLPNFYNSLIRTTRLERREAGGRNRIIETLGNMKTSYNVKNENCSK